MAVATGGVGREALLEAKPDYLFADFSEPDGFMSMLDEAGPRTGAPPALPDR